MNAIEAIQTEIDKREQEIEALRLSLSIISGKADVRVVSREAVSMPIRVSKPVARIPSVVPTVVGGITRKVWTKAEEQMLEEMWKEGISDEELSTRLNRSWHAVNVKRSKMGLVGFTRKRKKKGIEPQYPDRKYESWTTTEDDQLKKLSSEGFTQQQIADNIGRTLKAVEKRKRVLSVEGRKKSIFDDAPVSIGEKSNQPWSKADVEYLKELDSKGYDNRKIAGEMGRSPQAVAVRKANMGMSKRPDVDAKRKRRATKRVRWTKADDQMVVGMTRNGYTAGQIGRRLKRTAAAIRVRLYGFKSSGKL